MGLASDLFKLVFSSACITVVHIEECACCVQMYVCGGLEMNSEMIQP